MNRFLFILFLCFGVNHLYGQINATVQELYWVKYKGSVSLNEKWTLNGSAEDRRYFKSNRQHMWLFTGEVNRKIQNGWSLGGGLTKWSTLMPSDPESEFEVTQHDWRPFIYTVHKKNRSANWSFSQRIKLEQRFRNNRDTDQDTGAPVILPGFYNYTRLRIRGKANYLINPDGKIPTSLTLYNEFMIHWGYQGLPDFYDQNRLGGYFTFDFTDQLDLRIGYTNWFQRRNGAGNFNLRHSLTCYITQKF